MENDLVMVNNNVYNVHITLKVADYATKWVLTKSVSENRLTITMDLQRILKNPEH